GRVGVRRAVLHSLLSRRLIGRPRLCDARLVGLAKCLANDAQQVLLEKLRHLAGLRMHDAIEAEVQVGLVELEQLLQQADQAFSLFLDVRHVTGFSCVLLAHTTAQRTAKSSCLLICCWRRASRSAIIWSRSSMISSSTSKMRWRSR